MPLSWKSSFGIEIALAGDVVIAADTCRFSQLDPARGIHATGGATTPFVQRSGRDNAIYHLLTCDEFDAQEEWRDDQPRLKVVVCVLASK